MQRACQVCKVLFKVKEGGYYQPKKADQGQEEFALCEKCFDRPDNSTVYALLDVINEYARKYFWVEKLLRVKENSLERAKSQAKCGHPENKRKYYAAENSAGFIEECAVCEKVIGKQEDISPCKL